MFIKTDTLAYQLTEYDIRQAHPSVIFAEAFTAPDGYAPVMDAPQPEFNPLVQTLTEGAPVEVDGVWQQTWVINEIYPTPEHRAAVIAQAERAAAKVARDAAVAAIKVTTAAGNVFDGDEVSQGRMARAVMALSTGFATTATWVLADNSVIQATAAELSEALALAGMAQTDVWVV